MAAIAGVMLAGAMASAAIGAGTLSTGTATATTGTIECRVPYPAPQCWAQPYDTSANIAAQARGMPPAVAKDVIPGYPEIHQAGFANDGYYGNGASWIADSDGSWVKLDLGCATTVTAVRFGRDRIPGGLDEREPGQFTIATALKDVYANGDETNDATEYVLQYQSVKFNGTIAGTQTLQVALSNVTARYIKITTLGIGAIDNHPAIDEIEVSGVQCGPVVKIGTAGTGPVSTGTTTTKQDPIATAVSAPVGTQVTIQEQQSTGTVSPTGYALLDQQVTISVTPPPASPPTVDAPLQFAFKLDNSVVGTSAGKIAIYRNGAAVPLCTDPSAVKASPDPCRLAPVQDSTSTTFKVYTTAASTWNFALPVNLPPDKASCKDGGWTGYTDDAGQEFRNQGQCVSWVNHHPAAPPPPPPAE